MSAHGGGGSHSASPSRAAGGGIVGTAIMFFAGLLTVIIVIYGMTEWWNSEEKKEETSPAAQVWLQPAPAPVVILQPKGGREMTSYQFTGNGCVHSPIYLEGDWISYPKGGEIIFFSTDTDKEVHRDAPGVDRKSKLPGGYYRICRAVPAATGVEIWR